MTIEIALLVSIVSVCLSAIFGFAGYRRNSNNDVETQARRDAIIETKLDQIVITVNELKERFNKVDNKLHELEMQVDNVDRKADKANRRIDEIENSIK